MSDAGRVVCIYFPDCVQSRQQQFQIIVLNLPPEQKKLIEKMQYLCQFREDISYNQSTQLKHSTAVGDSNQYTLKRSLRLKFCTESTALQFHQQTYRRFKLGGQWLQIDLMSDLVDQDDAVDGQVILEGLVDVQSRPNSRHCIALQLSGSQSSQEESDFEYYARTFKVKAVLSVEGCHIYYLFLNDIVSCSDFELHISEVLPLQCYYHAEEDLAESLFNRFVTEQNNSQDNSFEYCGDRYYIKKLEISTDQMIAQGQQQELVKEGSARGDGLQASEYEYEDNSDQADVEQFLESLAANQGSSTTQEFDQLSSSQSIQIQNGDQNSQGDLAVILPAVDQFVNWSNLGCVLCQRRFQTRLHLEVHLRDSACHNQRFQQFVSDLQKYHHEQAALMFSQFSTQPKQQLQPQRQEQSQTIIKRKQSQQMTNHQAEFQISRQWGIKKQKRQSDASSYSSWGAYESIRGQSSQEVHDTKDFLSDTLEKFDGQVNDNSSDQGANAGEQLLKKIGWSGTGGLGKNGQGVKLAFEPQIYKKGKGIGASKSLPLSQYNNNNQEYA